MKRRWSGGRKTKNGNLLDSSLNPPDPLANYSSFFIRRHFVRRRTEVTAQKICTSRTEKIRATTGNLKCGKIDDAALFLGTRTSLVSVAVTELST